MADYWIKWYHEILDDPKMATLPDRLWRRFSELCLLGVLARKTPQSPRLTIAVELLRIVNRAGL